MGDAADDVFEAEDGQAERVRALRAAGCRPCLHSEKDTDGCCLVCEGMGWLDANGDPIEW